MEPTLANTVTTNTQNLPRAKLRNGHFYKMSKRNARENIRWKRAPEELGAVRKVPPALPLHSDQVSGFIKALDTANNTLNTISDTISEIGHAQTHPENNQIVFNTGLLMMMIWISI